MKLVKFEDGTYGVRKFWLFGWHFADLKNPGFNWTSQSRWFRDCKGTEAQARAVCGRYEVIE